MPSPPPTPIQTANEAAMITIPLPKEIIRDSFGRSMAVKYPAPVILNPTTRNDRLNILNTDADYCLSPSSFSEMKIPTSQSAPAMEEIKAIPATPTDAVSEYFKSLLHTSRSCLP